MSLSVHTRVVEWIFRTRALRGARAQGTSSDLSRRPTVQQAKLLIEVARRVLEPVDPLPPGDRGVVALPLYRSAIRGLLAAFGAHGSPEDSPAEEMAALWEGAPPPVLARAQPDPGARERVKVSLSSAAFIASPTEEEILTVRRFAESLAREASARPKQVDLLLAQRWLRVLLVGLVLALLVVGICVWRTRPDLAKGKPFWTSSRSPSCPAAVLPCAGLMFHTDEELNPWVEIDLGSQRVIRQIAVSNRADCCTDRAIPLIAEISRTGGQWTEVGRRTADFVSWTAKFPPATARYVRLRVPRRTTFHLHGVAVR